MTLDMIPRGEESGDSTNLLYFLGCLPGGSSFEIIKQLKPDEDPSSIHESLTTLVNLKLIKQIEEERVDCQVDQKRYKIHALIQEFTQ